ncbi:2787_t:CDS:2, partial [Cetraspora pellucida]
MSKTMAVPMKNEGNQIGIKPLEIAAKVSTDVVEAPTSYVPFAPLIDIFLNLGQDIVTLDQKAEHNKRLGRYLTERLKFITDVSQLVSFGKFLHAGNIVKKYSDLSNTFDGYIESLYQAMNKTLVKNSDFKKAYEIKVIRADLVEMKKFMFAMSDGKTGSDENTFTDIKRIRELSLDDYEPKHESESCGKKIHCRWNNATLLEYAFKEIHGIDDEQTEKEISKSNDGLEYYLVTEWMENGNLQEYYGKHTLDWNKKFEFAIDICRGIAFLNSIEVREYSFNLTDNTTLNSASVLINSNHKAKIANFGLRDITRDIQISLENIGYIAPEKLEHGALLWEIAEEEIPYIRQGIDLQTIQDRVVKEKYREPFSSDAPKVWQDNAYTAMHHDPNFRPRVSKILTTLYDYHHKDEKKTSPMNEFEDDFIIDDSDDSFMTVDAAVEEHQKPDGDRQKAWECFNQFAEQGGITAKYWVAYYLYHCILPEHKDNRQENLQRAVNLFKETADCGKVEAQLRYGFCLWQGY